MATSSKSVLLLALLAALWCGAVQADKKTVCTITVNSSDEKEMFRQRLPKDKFQFVELVERGRPDWLASACQKGVQCDVLVISGHFAGTDFFSDQLDSQEFLPVDEMERVSCSDSCPGLFSRLKEVYLFGCNTLNGETVESDSAKIARGLVRSGRTRAEDERQSRALNGRHGESSRDRMRRIFSNVPVIYGFSSKAPVGQAAAGILSRYFQTAAVGEVGSGRVSSKLLGHFAASSMAAASGMRDSDPQANYRDEVCQFFDQRLLPAQKLDFIHQILGRNTAEVRTFFDRIEKFSAALTDQDRQAPSFSRELDEIARDQIARDRYLALVRDTERPAMRARMIMLAGAFAWLSPADQRTELVRVIGEVLAGSSMGSADVEFICSLNDGHELDTELDRFTLSPLQATKATHNAALACLGSAEGHARVLQALSSAEPQDVQVAQVYFRHHPITDVTELRAVAMAIARMAGSEAKVRALDTLARHYLADRESLGELVRLFPLSESVSVQRAIAGILIRSDYKAIAKPELIRTLSERRLRSPDGEDVIDVLIRRLRVS
jgi:hypothetical protein